MPADGHPDHIQVAPGDVAPDFTLPDADGRPLRLTDLHGQWVVLYFYPEDGTPGCTIEAKRFRAYFESISLQKAAVIGVSRDSVASHCAFRDKCRLPFELLADADGAVHDLYGAWRHPLLRRKVLQTRRCTFLIDPEGRVAKVYPKVNVLGHAQEVVADLERLARPVTA